MADTTEPPSPVRALRDAFGDPKPPDISRKITACVACRKQKIKCHMDSKPPCTRCRKRGLPCTVNKSLQMLLESDTTWKHSMECRMQKLEAFMAKMASPEDLEQLGSLVEDASPPAQEDGRDLQAHDAPQNHGKQVNHWEIIMDLDSGPGAIPGFFISRSPPTSESGVQDLISRGVISLKDAQQYLDAYQNRLDHFPYRILADSTSSLEHIRESSPLLTAAVCTVGALHLASPHFEACYDEFVSLSARQSLSKTHMVDDVRALCIGAFWLSDLSWTLVGTAVRIATELQLHKSIFKAMQGDRAAYLRTRLYYLVYTCDHHFSVAFGRPPMTRECEAIRNVREFAGCAHATEDDARLASQVLRWSICSNIFDTFGVNVERPLSDAEVPHLRRFGAALDSLRAEWAEKFTPNAFVGNYPRKGVGLQYCFAQLYLYSHAFRGAGSGRVEARSHEAAIELDEAANSAVQAALAILRTVIADEEIQSYLDGLPTYFDTMIAFAVVFLLKMATKFSATVVRLDVGEITTLMSSLVAVLKRVGATMHPRHLLVNITKGIDLLVQRCCPSENAAAPAHSAATPRHSDTPDPSSQAGEFSWATGQALDTYFMGEYDFLIDQDIDLNLDFL